MIFLSLIYLKCATLLRKDHPEVSLSEGIPSCGREINFGSSGYSTFYKSRHVVSSFFHPCFDFGLDDWLESTEFLYFLYTALILCYDADLIQMFIWYHCHTSYLSSLFFAIFFFQSCSSLEKKKITKNIIDENFPNWQSVTWHFNEGQFGPWPQDSASQTVLIWSQTLEIL